MSQPKAGWLNGTVVWMAKIWKHNRRNRKYSSDCPGPEI